MATQNMDDIEEQERIVWSSSRLYLRLLDTFPKYVHEFQAKWTDWQEAISSGCADASTTWSSVPSFHSLTALGPKIIPLVVYQLALNPDDRTAVHLYSTLEPDTNYIPEDSSASPGQDILRLSFERNRAVRNALADFIERSERLSRYSSFSIHTECSEYDSLLAFGQSIIPHVMLQYAQDITKTSAHGIGAGFLFWYELLHELVWGSKTGLMSIGDFGKLYKGWELWFEGGEGGESPPKFGAH
ncbi:hypothetical protein QBC42DRAFT_262333 [Cladorrhinum samala]|uniref:Uncharacterized protein n=1 Tax=Cladorrhinum samala TaxID=585594 RepID=A0AAV9HXY4_9PEZI|nr:hypothetical protein QBC42DRAFT_262333 [Cladorrhinum samala]